jgi:aminoglycoside 3-N-acetyltransferase
MDGLRTTGASASKVIDGLLDILGEEGTLAVPTFPLYIDERRKISKDTIRCGAPGVIHTYNPSTTIAWTGVIPNKFLTYPGVVRSRFPVNTLAAKGPLAAEMMKHNLEGHEPLPCGNNSSWKFCSDNHAKILCLGVPAHHSLTMIHVAEDILDDRWPVKDWYYRRRYIIKDGDRCCEVEIRERHPRWAQYISEYTLRKDLIKAGLLKVKNVQGICMEFIGDSDALVKFLLSRNSNGYPFYIWRERLRRLF